MKNIVESLNEIQDITPYLKKEKVDEGLKDLLQSVRNRFKEAWNYLKSVVVRVGCYFWPVDKDGNVLPAVTPLTAGKAYASGLINKNKTFVCLDPEGAKITGCNTKMEDAVSIYGDEQDPWTYYRRILPKRRGLFNIFENDNSTFEEIITEAKIERADKQSGAVITSDDQLMEVVMRFVNNPGLARLMIWGAPGIGKTAILKKVVKAIKKNGRKGYKLITKTLSNETPDNFTLPAYEVGDDGKPIASVDLPKTWLPVYKPTGDDDEDQILSDNCGEGLLFIDELSRTKDDVLNVILPLINEGEFNGYKVGKKWTIVVASNRMEDDKGQNQLGTALSNRFIQYHFEPTVDSWLVWARKQNYMSPVILNWLEMGSDKGGKYAGRQYYYWDANDHLELEEPTTLMCTPRSWTNALQYMSTFVKTQADYDAGNEYGDLTGYKIFDLPQDIIREALLSALPVAAVEAFMSFYSIIDKVGDFEKVCSSVWKSGKGPKLSRQDLAAVTLPLAQIIINSHAQKLPTAKEMENLFTWVASLDSESMASAVLDVIMNTYCQGLAKDAKDNFFIMNAIRRDAGLDAAEEKVWKKLWEPWCKTWGITYAKFPDYENAIEILIKKYGEVFTTIKIDGHANPLA